MQTNNLHKMNASQNFDIPACHQITKKIKWTNLFVPCLPATALVVSSQAREVDLSPLNIASRCMDDLQQTPGICSSPPQNLRPSTTN